ncbi:MAG: TolC family protein [Bacteroidales bacterium]|nr:TolC family protein [Bacteroidales bacterium]
MKGTILKILFPVVVATIFLQPAVAQEAYTLTLDEAIALASDSSIDAFVAQNNYLVEYWYFKNYKAGKLPFLDLTTEVGNFSRSNSLEYNFTDSTDYYVEKQTFSNSVDVSLNQVIAKTGGRVYLSSDIARLENLKRNTPVQYSSTIVSLGIQQELFGFNPYKWDDKIMPLQFEASQLRFTQSLEEISVKTVLYFFDLAKAQVNYEIAAYKLANSDTLYSIGQKRFDIGSITQEDLFRLQLDQINGKNDFKQAKNNLKRAKTRFNSFLRLGENIHITLIMPDNLPELYVNPLSVLELARKNNPDFKTIELELLNAARSVDKTKKESRLSGGLNASFGLNQTANALPESYHSPNDQELVSLTLSIPILDWGVAKGKHTLALRQQEVVKLKQQQALIDLEQNIINTVDEFFVQKDIVAGAAKADTIAQKAFDITKRQFVTGNADLTKLNMVQQAQIAAKQQYIAALELYWNYFYFIRKLTLYDFLNNIPLTENALWREIVDEE